MSPRMRATRVTGILVLAAIAVSGCGAKTTGGSTAAHRPTARRPPPAYRVGQYCLVTKEAKYRAVGLTCSHHHLARP
ncbi:MAG TPA: hypothetical protein VMF09_12840 [Solirubrobacteraceae bacterium]|nr:hypothetical protein [Solirubrobacteraceae bacterium]